MKTITTDQLKGLREKNGGLTLVNTLEADSFEKTRIPGAVNVPLNSSDFMTRVEQEAGGKHKPIVVTVPVSNATHRKRLRRNWKTRASPRCLATREAQPLGRKKLRKCKLVHPASNDAKVSENSRKAAPHTGRRSWRGLDAILIR